MNHSFRELMFRMKSIWSKLAFFLFGALKSSESPFHLLSDARRKFCWNIMIGIGKCLQRIFQEISLRSYSLHCQCRHVLNYSWTNDLFPRYREPAENKNFLIAIKTFEKFSIFIHKPKYFNRRDVDTEGAREVHESCVGAIATRNNWEGRESATAFFVLSYALVLSR